MGKSMQRPLAGQFGSDDRRARVERALEHAALLVDRQGDAFLPIFVRLEAELAAMTQKTDAVGRARARVAQMAMR
jgi:hypothetical protein